MLNITFLTKYRVSPNDTHGHSQKTFIYMYVIVHVYNSIGMHSINAPYTMHIIVHVHITCIEYTYI